jgi:radical SAM protein with 4Fe4S-binding SPASM domain
VSTPLKVLNSSAFKRHTPYWLQRLTRRRVVSSGAFETFYRRSVDQEIDAMSTNGSIPPPKVVYAESTNACNAACVMCPRDEMERTIGIMPMELFQKVVDECAEWGVEELRLHNFGEPLIDRKIFEKIEYAKRRGIPTTTIYSNAALLDEERARKLIEAGLDKLYISFDGATKETFEAIRLPLSFEQVCANTRGIYELRERMGSMTPKILLTFTNMQQGDEEVQKFLRDWEPYSDNVFIIDAHDWAGQAEVKLHHQNEGPRWPCVYLWKSMTVLYSGEVTLCCMDIKGSEHVGNAKEASLREIWNGAVMRKIRSAHREHQYGKVNMCKDCSLNRMWSLYD